MVLRRIAAGDRRALGDLYDRHGGLLLGVGMKMLGDRAEAEDVLHDVFLEVWKRAHTYDRKRATVRTWLLVRMRSRCLDRRKSAAYARRDTLEKDNRAIAPAAAKAADEDRIRRAVSELSEDQRRVVLLGYFGGLSSREIAEELELPIGTVKSRLAAAVKRLRSQLLEGAAS